MSASFKRIDYSLRPAKHAERKMLCDIFRKLRPFGRIEEYVYVGFGSVWFSDFILFHRSLGVKEMISIEEAQNTQERIDDNRPFRIQMDYRNSNHALPDLDWTRNQFIWLDYDDPLSPNMLLDMRTIARRAGSGTVLAVSVQCTQAIEISEAKADTSTSIKAIERFITKFGRDRVSPSTVEDQLYGWAFGRLSREIILQEVEAELGVRNSDINEPETLFQPICEIEYTDGAKMTTIVGIFYSSIDEKILEECHFQTLDFLPSPPKPVRISVPKLTVKEFKKLESQLPLPQGIELELGTIPVSEAKTFAEMYRYLPNFAVLE